MPRLRGLRMSTLPPRRLSSAETSQALDGVLGEGDEAERALEAAVDVQRDSAAGAEGGLKQKTALAAGARWFDAALAMLSLGSVGLLSAACDWVAPQEWTAAAGLEEAATLTVFLCALLMLIPRREGDGPPQAAAQPEGQLVPSEPASVVPPAKAAVIPRRAAHWAALANLPRPAMVQFADELADMLVQRRCAVTAVLDEHGVPAEQRDVRNVLTGLRHVHFGVQGKHRGRWYFEIVVEVEGGSVAAASPAEPEADMEAEGGPLSHLPTYSLTDLLACPLSLSLACLLGLCLPTYPPARLLTSLLGYSLTHLLSDFYLFAYSLTCLLTYLSK